MFTTADCLQLFVNNFVSILVTDNVLVTSEMSMTNLLQTVSNIFKLSTSHIVVTIPVTEFLYCQHFLLQADNVINILPQQKFSPKSI